MGLLSLGTPLDWPETQKLADHVRKHGIIQLLNLWHKIKDRRGDRVLWGDEIEYVVVSFDEETKNARLSLRQGEILKVLAESHEQSCEEIQDGLEDQIPTFHPEYGRYMLESTPGAPYGASPKELRAVEPNMRMRRRIARRHLKPNELPITLTSFPRLGVTDGLFLDDETLKANGQASQSLFLPDEIINQHARFPTLTANIRKRRGAKVAINLPVFFDEKTPRPFIDPTIPWDRDWFPGDSEAKEGAAKEDHIYMDSMGFGMGCCCLQVTFQACSIHEARAIYDQLVPVTPLILALTAASPAYRGYLADVDARWSVISGAVDDRTPEERGLSELEGNTRGSRMRMAKSRYDSVDSYLSTEQANRADYNDIQTEIDEDVQAQLIEAGMDHRLSTHFAHLFIRDPLVIFSEMVDQDDAESMDHFENIQSTNWQTMRFKPPPPGGKIGWRVEVRSMEVQVTDFENAAFSVFIVLLTRAILSFRLNFYLPISKVDENMRRAQNRDAAGKEKFYFRKNVSRTISRHHSRERSMPHSREPSVNGRRPVAPEAGATNNGGGPSTFASGTTSNFRRPLSSTYPTPATSRAGSPAGWLPPVEEEYDEYTLDELINGRPGRKAGETSSDSRQGGGPSGVDEDGDDGSFPGLLGLVNLYLDALDIDVETRCEMDMYLDLVRKRANGTLMTTATWIRNYVRSHPSYKFDSVVSQEITFDMIKKLDRIERGVEDAPGFLPAGYAARRRKFDTRESTSNQQTRAAEETRRAREEAAAPTAPL
ncbi:unnamed protein product [Jaminaea pallidilutea]